MFQKEKRGAIVIKKIECGFTHAEFKCCVMSIQMETSRIAKNVYLELLIG